ncbi:hypothetical protein [Actinomadura fulvescens]
MAMTEPGTLPCLQVAGIQVYLYLDADDHVVRVAVHLDTTDEELLASDGTVPIEVVVGDTIVMDHTGRTADTVLCELLDSADEQQQQAIRDAAITAGLLWRCTCDWYNPGDRPRCDSCASHRPHAVL